MRGGICYDIWKSLEDFEKLSKGEAEIMLWNALTSMDKGWYTNLRNNNKIGGHGGTGMEFGQARCRKVAHWDQVAKDILEEYVEWVYEASLF